MALEPGFATQFQSENDQNNTNVHQIVLPSLNKEHIQKVKFDLPEERDNEFSKPKMPPLPEATTENVPHQIVQSEVPAVENENLEELNGPQPQIYIEEYIESGPQP
jgi:hypothetical protein